MTGIVEHNGRRFPACDWFNGHVLVTLVDVDIVRAGGGKSPGDCALMMAPDGSRYCRLRTNEQGIAVGAGLDGWEFTTAEDRAILEAAASGCMRPGPAASFPLVLPNGGARV
jgi:hypothetical protein